MTESEIKKAVDAEMRRAVAKYPVWDDLSAVEAAAVVSEETGELVRAANREMWEGKSASLTDKEAVQVIVTATRFLLSRGGAQVTKLKPLRAR